MTAASRIEPFFLSGSAGPLHCTLFSNGNISTNGPGSNRCALIIPPFAEEMNKCRPMMASLARRLASGGMDTVILDLFGTGDSGGDFADATWAQWTDDLQTVQRWLSARGAHQINVVAVRSGALLIDALSIDSLGAQAKLALWQPVIKGADYWRQFLRLRVAADAMRQSNQGNQPAPKDILARDGCIEIAGYTISRSLADSLSSSELQASVVAAFSAALWCEVTSMSPAEFSMGAKNTLSRWQESGLVVDSKVVHGESFWSTPELAWVPSLIDVTSEFFA